MLPAAVFSPSDRSTLELDVRWRRRGKPRWRQQSFAEAVRRSRQFRRRTAASDGHEQALPTLSPQPRLRTHRPEAPVRTCPNAPEVGPGRSGPVQVGDTLSDWRSERPETVRVHHFGSPFVQAISRQPSVVAGWHPGPLRASSPGTNHAVPPDATVRRYLHRRDRGGHLGRAAAVRQRRVRRFPRLSKLNSLPPPSKTDCHASSAVFGTRWGRKEGVWKSYPPRSGQADHRVWHDAALISAAVSSCGATHSRQHPGRPATAPAPSALARQRARHR